MAEVGNVSWKQAAREDFQFCCETFDKPGLERIVQSAADKFKEIHGFSLPWNIAHCGILYGLNKYKKHKVRDFRVNPIETTARFCGWLNVAVDDSVITHFIRKTQSVNGMWSPVTRCDLWKVAERHPSPGAFRKWILAVDRRSRQILKPYGLKPSWRALASVAETGPRKVGKAAFRVAAKTCRQLFESTVNITAYFLNSLSDVEVLTRLSGVLPLIQLNDIEQELVFLTMAYTKKSIREAMDTMDIVKDETDGVTMFFNRSLPLIANIHGVTIEGGVLENGNVHYLYRLGSRSYHHYSPHDIKVILRHWQQRRNLQEWAMRTFSKPDRTVLVWVKDSITAGNCMAGTKSFMDKHGITKPFMPATELAKYAEGNDFVARTLKLVASQI